MTQKEAKERMFQARANFYSWKPPGNNGYFRCYHIQPYPLMTEQMCMDRAKRPDIYENAGCSLSCPRWKHYRKLFKKTQKLPPRKPYPIGG